jgi:hypothetical protein
MHRAATGAVEDARPGRGPGAGLAVHPPLAVEHLADPVDQRREGDVQRPGELLASELVVQRDGHAQSA